MLQGAEDEHARPLFTDLLTNRADKLCEVMGVDSDVLFIYFIECCISCGLREVRNFLKFLSSLYATLSDNKPFSLFS